MTYGMNWRSVQDLSRIPTSTKPFAQDVQSEYLSDQYRMIVFFNVVSAIRAVYHSNNRLQLTFTRGGGIKYHLGRLRLNGFVRRHRSAFLHFVPLTSGLHASGRLCTRQSGSLTSPEHWLTIPVSILSAISSTVTLRSLVFQYFAVHLTVSFLCSLFPE